MRAAAITGVRDVMPTYRSVAVFFDPLRTKYDDLLDRLGREADRARRHTAGATPAAPDSGVLWRRVRTRSRWCCRTGEHVAGAGRRGSFERDLPRLHARLSPRLCLHGPRRSPHRRASAPDTASAVSRRIGRHRRAADGDLSRPRRRAAGSSWAERPSGPSTSTGRRRSCSGQEMRSSSFPWTGTSTSDWYG